MKILNFARIWTLVITSIFIIFINLIAEKPIAWKVKAEALKKYSPEIGPLNGVVRSNNFLMNKSLKGHALAFGNSQVGSVFANEKNGKDSISWIFIPSTPIVCYKYFAEDIIKAQPKSVILYLSDIDMTINPFFIPLKYHNFPILEYLNDQYEVYSNDFIFSKEEFNTVLFSELIKPLKESVFLKTFVNKAMFSTDTIPEEKRKMKIKNDKVKAKLQKTKPKPTKKKKPIEKEWDVVKFDEIVENYDEQIKKLIRNRNKINNADRINYNLKKLSEFCSNLNDNGIITYIADGQYHPNAYDYEGKEVDHPTKLIEDFCAKYSYVHRIPLSAMTKLNTNGFIDYIHFTKNGGKKIRNEIAQYINNRKSIN